MIAHLDEHFIGQVNPRSIVVIYINILVLNVTADSQTVTSIPLETFSLAKMNQIILFVMQFLSFYLFLFYLISILLNYTAEWNFLC